MRHVEKITPAAGALTAMATLACCLPVGFAAAIATTSVAAAVASHRWWFLGASMVLVAIGAGQLGWGRRSCARRSTVSIAILVLSAATVALVIFFPQVVATIVADLTP
jgi:hypothetical protein